MIEPYSNGGSPRRRGTAVRPSGRTAVRPEGRRLAPGGLEAWSGKVIGLLASPAHIDEETLSGIASELASALVPGESGGWAWAAPLRFRGSVGVLGTADREDDARLAQAQLVVCVNIENAPPSFDRVRLAQFATVHGWLWAGAASENTQLDVPQARTADEVTRVGLVRKRPDISHDEFGRHWVISHAPLVLEHGPLFNRYVANVLIDDANWDGFVEQRFADPAAADEHERQVAEEKAEVREDLQRFIGSLLPFEATNPVGPVAFTAKNGQV